MVVAVMKVGAMKEEIVDGGKNSWIIL